MFGIEKVVRKVIEEFFEKRDKEKYYIYVFVRKDIPIWAQVVQVGHACFEAGRIFHDDVIEIPNLVLLKVEDEHHLRYAETLAAQIGVRSFSFYEPEESSLGPDNRPSFTALCTEPILGEKHKPQFEEFELWKAEVV